MASECLAVAETPPTENKEECATMMRQMKGCGIAETSFIGQ
jgi:hypothetical protein